MGWQKIKNPDVSILDRLTEFDIANWMAAKMASQCPDHKVEHFHVSASVDYSGQEPGAYSIEWTLQGGDACSVINRTFRDALADHQEKLKAIAPVAPAELRRKAAELLSQAERLENSAN